MPAPLPPGGSLDGRCPHHARLVACPNMAEPLHPCPYLQDVEEDDETECTCCKACTRECAGDV